MSIDEYLDSEDFLLFKDKTLYVYACEAVDEFLKNNDPVKNSQLHSIQTIIQAAALKGLDHLSENQIKKNTHEENKSFWNFVRGLLFEVTAGEPPSYSLRFKVESELTKKNFLLDEGSPEKIEQRKARRSNKDAVNRVMDKALSVYFEHFNCHYFYRIKQGGV